MTAQVQAGCVVTANRPSPPPAAMVSACGAMAYVHVGAAPACVMTCLSPPTVTLEVRASAPLLACTVYVRSAGPEPDVLATSTHASPGTADQAQPAWVTTRNCAWPPAAAIVR